MERSGLFFYPNSYPNFGFSKYRTEQHHWVSKVDMTFDGFMFLAMGYQGKKAARLKEAYIAEFNHMRHWIGCRLAAGDFSMPVNRYSQEMPKYSHIR